MTKKRKRNSKSRPSTSQSFRKKHPHLKWLIPILILVCFIGIFRNISKDQENVETVDLPPIPVSSSMLNHIQNQFQPQVDFILLSNAWDEGENTFSDQDLGITFKYPKYFDTGITDIPKANSEWAERYKNNPNVEQPLHSSNFLAYFTTPHHELAQSQEFCDNKMYVSVEQFRNPTNLQLYDFIAQEYKSPLGTSSPTTWFDILKNNFTLSDTPQPGSYIYEGGFYENPTKIVFFTKDNAVYKFQMSGNCNTGGQYTQDAENVFDKMISTISFN